MEAPKVDVKEVVHIPKKKSSLLLYIIVGGVVSLIVLGLLVAFYLGLLPLPHKPQFILQDTILCGLKFSDPNLLTCNLQVTLSTRNPNTNYRISIEKLDVRAFYQNQQITLATELPPSYLSSKKIITWTPFLYGNDVPVSPHVAANLMVDLNNVGNLPLVIKVDGSLKWKISPFTFGEYRLIVNSPVDIPLGSKGNGTIFDAGVKYVFEQSCKVRIQNEG